MYIHYVYVYEHVYEYVNVYVYVNTHALHTHTHTHTNISLVATPRGFLFWTVFMAAVSPLRAGGTNRLSDIVLVDRDDKKRRLVFYRDEKVLQDIAIGKTFALETKVRKSGAGENMAIVESGKVSRPFYVLTFPFIGFWCKVFLFGFLWEKKGWGLGGLNLGQLYLPTLGIANKDSKQVGADARKAIKVQFRDDKPRESSDTPQSPVDDDGYEVQTKAKGAVWILTSQLCCTTARNKFRNANFLFLHSS
jgi:hypothetical protein